MDVYYLISVLRTWPYSKIECVSDGFSVSYFTEIKLWVFWGGALWVFSLGAGGSQSLNTGGIVSFWKYTSGMASLACKHHPVCQGTETRLFTFKCSLPWTGWCSAWARLRSASPSHSLRALRFMLKCCNLSWDSLKRLRDWCNGWKTNSEDLNMETGW